MWCCSRYFTRFTEEAFASLVGIIFIVESLKKIFSKLKWNLFDCENKNGQIISTEMSKYFKIHKNFDLDTITLEEPCRCEAPFDGEKTIFSNIR